MSEGTELEGERGGAMNGNRVVKSGKKELVPLDQMRAYRACLNCRNRKSKCDLDINQGRPVSTLLFCFGSVSGAY